MSGPRTRSKYRFAITPESLPPPLDGLTPPVEEDRQTLAELMLNAYRGTIDDEGETITEALEAVDEMFTRAVREHSFVLKIDGAAVAMCFVIVFRDMYCIDPIVVAASRKRAGLGRRMVQTSLASLAARGISEVRATITDGNVASERLFASLGAHRVGPWPPLQQ